MPSVNTNTILVWCPKYRQRVSEGTAAEFVEQTLRMLFEWKDIEILELSIKEDHIHNGTFYSTKMQISEAMGILKGKEVLKLFKSFSILNKKPYWETIFGVGDTVLVQ